MADESERRGQRIPVSKWWWESARRRIEERKAAGQPHTQKELAELWREDWQRREADQSLDWWEDREPRFSDPQIMRCIHPDAFNAELTQKERHDRFKPTLEAVTALSRILEIRCPVFLAATEQEAFLLGSQASEYRTGAPVAVRLAKDVAREALSPRSGEATTVVRSKRPARSVSTRAKKSG